MSDEAKTMIRQIDADITGLQWIRDEAEKRQWEAVEILSELTRHKRNMAHMRDNQCTHQPTTK